MQHSLLDIPSSKYAELIPLINSLSSYDLFSEEKTHLKTAPLPFFKDYKLLSAQAFSTIPPVTMHYLWNGKDNDIIKMEGTRDSVFDNLHKLRLILDESTIVPYVKFVLDGIWTDKGNIRLVESLDEIEFSDSPSREDLKFLETTIRPATVSQSEEGYLIDAIIIYGTEIYHSIIGLRQDGIFDFRSETQLKGGMRCVRVIFLE